MPVFTVIIDKAVIHRMRTEIEAETLEEAETIALEKAKEPDLWWFKTLMKKEGYKVAETAK